MADATRNRLRTPLSTIRSVLDRLEAGESQYTIAKDLGVNCTTVKRWQLRAMREPTGWPTAADIDAWAADTAQKATERARRAAQVAAYRKATYINRGPLWVDSTGTVRRLRALVAIGWTQDGIAPHLGTSSQYVSLLTTGRHPKVHRDTATAVARIYDQLSMTIPTTKAPWVHDRQRRFAAKRGWAPPLAWPEGAIDRPEARPEGIAA